MSGYAWDVDLVKKSEDAYLTVKAVPGDGAWKERWSQYEEDYRILDRIKKKPDADRRLQIWGKSMEDMLLLRKLFSLIAVKHKSFIGLCDTGKESWFLFRHILEGHENLMPHIECGLV